MKFNYQARNKQGDIHAGFIESSSKEAAASLLRERGLYVTFLEEFKVPVYAKRVEILGRITKKDIAIFFRQLAIMFKTKVPLIEALKVIGSQTKNMGFRETILKLAEEVEGGSAFSQAVARFPKVFSYFCVAIIKSGEASGNLSETLNYLADHLEKEYHITAKVRGALVYPALIIFVVIAVVILLVFFVMPNLIEILEATGEELPLATVVVISATNFLRRWILLIVLILAGIIFYAYKYYSTREGKEKFDRFLLKVPIFGPLLQMIYLSRFAENLSTLISSGLPITHSLEIISDVVGSIPYKQAVMKTKEEVAKGETISSVLIEYPKLFSPIFVQMVLVGERTGKLGSVLMNLVSFYDQEVDRKINSLLGILEPLLIIVLGVIVGGIMLAILMPMYQVMPGM